jgi:cytochrome c-type biogenesis protein CcmF
VKEGSTFEIVSREAALVINNLLLSVILGLVFIGTLYPLVTQAMGRKISVGPPYFNTAIGPIALALAAIMTIGPMLRWRRDQLRLLAGRIAAPALLSAAVLLLVVILAPGTHWLPLLGLAFAPGVARPAWRRSGGAT